jgi:K+-transporting ATPase KdpF subunit
MIHNCVLIVMNAEGIRDFSGYIPAGILALFILGYLVYALVKPEKF